MFGPFPYDDHGGQQYDRAATPARIASPANSEVSSRLAGISVTVKNERWENCRHDPQQANTASGALGENNTGPARNMLGDDALRPTSVLFGESDNGREYPC